jgi:hypothetical protein
MRAGCALAIGPRLHQAGADRQIGTLQAYWDKWGTANKLRCADLLHCMTLSRSTLTNCCGSLGFFGNTPCAGWHTSIEFPVLGVGSGRRHGDTTIE